MGTTGFNSNQVINPFIEPATPQEIRSIITKVGLSATHNKDLLPENLPRILNARHNDLITIGEKNQLLMKIIINQLRVNSKYLNRIPHLYGKGFYCHHCGGKGFQVILECEIQKIPCKGIPDKNILPCGGTGIKTSPCVRCNGLTLNDIINIKNSVTKSDHPKEHAHFKNLKIDVKRNKDNANKTFRIIGIGSGNSKRYYVPPNPCTTCKGSGKFVHDRKNIRCSCFDDLSNVCDKCGGSKRITGKPISCPGCKGVGYKKIMVTTNKVKHFQKCVICQEVGVQNFNPVIDIKKLPKETTAALMNIK